MRKPSALGVRTASAATSLRNAELRRSAREAQAAATKQLRSTLVDLGERLLESATDGRFCAYLHSVPDDLRGALIQAGFRVENLQEFSDRIGAFERTRASALSEAKASWDRAAAFAASTVNDSDIGIYIHIPESIGEVVNELANWKADLEELPERYALYKRDRDDGRSEAALEREGQEQSQSEDQNAEYEVYDRHDATEESSLRLGFQRLIEAAERLSEVLGDAQEIDSNHWNPLGTAGSELFRISWEVAARFDCIPLPGVQCSASTLRWVALPEGQAFIEEFDLATKALAHLGERRFVATITSDACNGTFSIHASRILDVAGICTDPRELPALIKYWGFAASIVAKSKRVFRLTVSW